VLIVVGILAIEKFLRDLPPYQRFPFHVSDRCGSNGEDDREFLSPWKKIALRAIIAAEAQGEPQIG